MDKVKLKELIRDLKNALAFLNLQTNMITKEEHIKFVGKCKKLVDEIEDVVKEK